MKCYTVRNRKRNNMSIFVCYGIEKFYGLYVLYRNTDDRSAIKQEILTKNTLWIKLFHILCVIGIHSSYT